jgi:hypothetical protein
MVGVAGGRAKARRPRRSPTDAEGRGNVFLLRRESLLVTLRREPTWNQNFGLLLVTWAVCAMVVVGVATLFNLSGVLGLAIAAVVFVATFLGCMYAVDRFVLAG